MKERLDRILVAEVPDFDGCTIVYSLKSPTDWKDLEEQIECLSDDGRLTVKARFSYKTQKWFDKIPEYEN